MHSSGEATERAMLMLHLVVTTHLIYPPSLQDKWVCPGSDYYLFYFGAQKRLRCKRSLKTYDQPRCEREKRHNEMAYYMMDNMSYNL